MVFGQPTEGRCVRCNKNLPIFKVGKTLYRNSVTLRRAPNQGENSDAPLQWWCGMCVTLHDVEDDEYVNHY